MEMEHNIRGITTRVPGYIQLEDIYFSGCTISDIAV